MKNIYQTPTWVLDTALARALAIPSNLFLDPLVIITNGPSLASTSSSNSTDVSKFPTGQSIPQMSGQQHMCKKNHHPTVIVCTFHYRAGTKNLKNETEKNKTHNLRSGDIMEMPG